MKQLALLICVLLAIQVTAQESAKLSPLTQIFLMKREQNKQVLPQNFVYRKVGNVTCISALLKIQPTVDEVALRALDVRVGTKAGTIWTALIPVDNLNALSRVKGVEYVQVDEPIFPLLDAARTVTRVDSVHAGLGTLPMPFHGDSVVVGIIDAGFAYRHPSLFDTTGTRYRVKRVWEQVNTGTPPAGFSYGNEITDTLAMWAKGYDLQGSHGAHVAGIAAGSGYGSPGNLAFKGMADASDLVLVGITPPPNDWTSTGMSSIIDALNYVYSYAGSVGRPCVANLSWGCSIGSHDGRSLFSQACDNLTGPGKIFTISAGNNGSNNIHIGKSFTPSDTIAKTFVTFDPFLGSKKTWVDIWGDSAQSFCIQLTLYNGNQAIDSTDFICLDNQLHSLYLSDGVNDSLLILATTSSQEFNGKPRIFLDLHNKTSFDVMITVKANNGTVNMWNGYVENTTGYYGNFVSKSITGVLSGNNSMTVGDMACTQSALTVGAFTTKTSYVNADNATVTIALTALNGNIAGFSSRGPTLDGRIKPDIAAPGMVIGSAVNSDDPDFLPTGGSWSSVVHRWQDINNNRYYPYAMLMGTSMSSPAAAGIVALMLQANPNLTPQQVKTVLAQSAIVDSKTGIIPSGGSNTWGAGKINAMAAILQAIAMTDVKDAKQYRSLYLYPNPANGNVALNCEIQHATIAQIRVVDMTGKSVYTESRTLQSGTNTIMLYTENWASGVYIVSLATSEGKFHNRLVVR